MAISPDGLYVAFIGPSPYTITVVGSNDLREVGTLYFIAFILLQKEFSFSKNIALYYLCNCLINKTTFLHFKNSSII